MATIVYLIRHGETEWNKLGKFQGSTDISLSEEGIKQAHLAADVLKGKFDHIYASPLSRAKHTAEIIGEASAIVPQIEPHIKEINFGLWEGLTFEEIKEKFPKEFTSWRNPLEGYLMSEDISVKNAGKRAGDTIRRLVTKHPGKKIAIVAHGGILKAGIIDLFHWDMTMYYKIFLGNTSITKLVFKKEDTPILMTLNNTSHLPEEAL
ncbi:MAG: histidine phosphatase family protein [Anaerocolumna sp.]